MRTQRSLPPSAPTSHQKERIQGVLDRLRTALLDLSKLRPAGKRPTSLPELVRAVAKGELPVAGFTEKVARVPPPLVWRARFELHEIAKRALGRPPAGEEIERLHRLGRSLVFSPGLPEVPQGLPLPPWSHYQPLHLWLDAGMCRMLEKARAPMNPRSLGGAWSVKLPLPLFADFFPQHHQGYLVFIAQQRWAELLGGCGMVGECAYRSSRGHETPSLVFKARDRQQAARAHAKERDREAVREARAKRREAIARIAQLGGDPLDQSLAEEGASMRDSYLLHTPGTARLPDLDGLTRDPERKDENVLHPGRLRDLYAPSELDVLNWLDPDRER